MKVRAFQRDSSRLVDVASRCSSFGLLILVSFRGIFSIRGREMRQSITPRDWLFHVVRERFGNHGKRSGVTFQPAGGAGKMAKRNRVSDPTQAAVLAKSRRRCCVCFGLKRDDSVKQGRIAHLDKKPGNNNESNLAFLCLDHHDQFDAKPSQSKNLTQTEIKRFRQELYEHYSPWGGIASPEYLLNYLAASISTKDIAKTLVKIGHEATASPNFQIRLALTEKEFELVDTDLAAPMQYILDNLASWGFLTYEFEDDEKNECFRFKINHANADAVQNLLKAVSEFDS